MEKQVAFVTGASQGLGQAISEPLAKDGWHVIVSARRQDALELVIAGIEAAGGSVEAALLDMCDPDAIGRVISAAAERHGRLDGVVNNAGRFSGRKILDTTVDEFRMNFRMKCEAPFLAMKAALPAMIALGRGAIVNIASVSGLRATPGTGGYSASKAGRIHLGAIAAMEVQGGAYWFRGGNRPIGKRF